MEKLLIIEDNNDIRKQLEWGFGNDYEVLFAGDSDSALKLFKTHYPKVVLLDLGLPPFKNEPIEGFICIENIMKIRLYTKVVVITGQNNDENSLKAIRLGAYDYYQKPINLDELKVIVYRAFHIYSVEEKNRKLYFELDKRVVKLGEMIGQCPEMREVFSIIKKVAPSDVSILIDGESGTGKELASRAIHSMSLRKDGPFIPIDCSAIPENLLESELFGFEKGAFTGAHMRVMGKVEFAHHGTLFLDEIGELPSNLQVKLLRFLQETNIQRVGGRVDIHVDTRIIAATNIYISKAIEKGKFRKDLFYRLGVITINLPPLRDRGEDKLLLAKVFLKKFANQFNRNVKGFSISCLDFIESYDWPGNVRELENMVQRAVIMAESSFIEPHDLGYSDNIRRVKLPNVMNVSLKEAKSKVEKLMIESVLGKHKGNITKAAGELRVSRPTLYDLMKKHGLRDNS